MSAVKQRPRAHYRNEQRGEFTVGISNEESNRIALSFEPACVRREGPDCDLSLKRAVTLSTWRNEYSGIGVVESAAIDVEMSRTKAHPGQS